jgi:hypothetical protein
MEIARQSSRIVVSGNKPVTPEVAGASPVAPVENPCKSADSVVAFENVIARWGSKRSKRDQA